MPIDKSKDDTVMDGVTETVDTDTTTVKKLEYKDVFDPIDGKLKSIRSWPIAVPMESATIALTDKLVEEFAINAEKNKTKDVAMLDTVKYANKIQNMYIGHWLHGEYDSFFTDADTLTQRVETSRGYLHIKGQKIGNKDTTLSGPSALMALQSVIGIGKPVKIPLWHSGIVLTVSNFKETESLSLANYLNKKRVELGYKTQGMLFSGDDVNIVMEIVDYILSHVITTNLQGWLVGDTDILKDLILVNDIPSMMAGALESMYPEGYPTERSCINSGTPECDFTVESTVNIGTTEFNTDTLLNFARCVWVDKSRLPQSAIMHMAATAETYTAEHIEEYQNTVNSTKVPMSVSMPIGESNVRLNYKIPTIRTYQTTGARWIKDVIQSVDTTMLRFNDLSNEDRAAKRKSFLEQTQYVLEIQKDAAWIDTMQFGTDDAEEPFLIEDADSIYDLLETVGVNPDIRALATAQINKCKVDTLFAFTGIPNYRCPVCGTSQVDDVWLERGIIPMDMVGYFFIIVGYQMLRTIEESKEN